MREIKNSSFTILGAGRSGVAIAKLLNRNGAKVFVSDNTKREDLKFFDETVLNDEGIEYEVGGHSDRVYQSDSVIKSPGIPPDCDVIMRAAETGMKIYSEIEAAFWFCKAPVIAITGTNGKTTTTILTGEIFKNAGYDVKVCGNVGLAFAEVAGETKKDSIVVLEVSSYQLNDIEEFRPKVAVMMNITPDHLDWHKSPENYLQAKMNITRNQKGDDLLVINYDDDKLMKASGVTKASKAFFSIKEDLKTKSINSGSFRKNDKVFYFDKTKNIDEEIMEAREINIRGNHNLYNSLAAVISARAFDIKKEIIKDTLATFAGVEHRIEFVRELNGVKYFNDSKATNIDSLIVALESFEKNVILILGGREKGNDYSVVDELVKNKVKKIIAIGETKKKISGHFGNFIEVTEADFMDDAVNNAAKNASPGDQVLLSPACKSFDMFDSFEHRGKEFKRSVNNLK